MFILRSTPNYTLLKYTCLPMKISNRIGLTYLKPTIYTHVIKTNDSHSQLKKCYYFRQMMLTTIKENPKELF